MSKEYNFVDKTAWLPGEWHQEPDKRQWTDEATGMVCLAVRNLLGSLCGYVGVPQDHPYFGMDYNDVDVEVHGGLTFSGLCQEDDKEHGVCHVPEPGQQGRVWWLGFDCAHAYDLSPAVKEWSQWVIAGEVYRTMEYVQAECAKLAQQLASEVTA